MIRHCEVLVSGGEIRAMQDVSPTLGLRKLSCFCSWKLTRVMHSNRLSVTGAPRLADKGIYVASKSSFYRVMMNEAQKNNHRGTRCN